MVKRLEAKLYYCCRDESLTSVCCSASCCCDQRDCHAHDWHDHPTENWAGQLVATSTQGVVASCSTSGAPTSKATTTQPLLPLLPLPPVVQHGGAAQRNAQILPGPVPPVNINIEFCTIHLSPRMFALFCIMWATYLLLICLPHFRGGKTG